MKLRSIIALVLTAVLLMSCSACTYEFVVHLGGTAQSTNTDVTPAPDTDTPSVQTEQTTASQSTEQITAAQSTEQTTAAQGTEQTTAAQQTEETTAAPAPSGAPQGTAAILAYYNTAANNIKTKAKSVTRNYEDYQHNEEKLVVPSMLQSAGSSLIGTFLKKNETPHTFEDVENFYLPGETYVSKLTEAQIKSAECKDNGTEYEITIVANTEKNPTYGQGVSAGFEIIKLDDVMDAAGFIVKSFDTEYYDCTVKCKVDKATGNVTWINFSTPIVMDVASKIGINATVGMTFVKDYTVAY